MAHTAVGAGAVLQVDRGIEGMGRMVSEDFDFLSESMAVAKEQMRRRPMRSSCSETAAFFARDIHLCYKRSPRQIKYASPTPQRSKSCLERQNRGGEGIRRAIERGFHQVFWGLIIAAFCWDDYTISMRAIGRSPSQSPRTFLIVLFVARSLLRFRPGPSSSFRLGSSISGTADRSIPGIR